VPLRFGKRRDEIQRLTRSRSLSRPRQSIRYVRRAEGYGLSLLGAGKFPMVLGNDFAGTVASVGAQVSTFHAGQFECSFCRSSLTRSFKTIGFVGTCSETHLMLSSGLNRWASAKAVFVSASFPERAAAAVKKV
jgi:NADPH:quinone reductase-like Zn-dependent oxidoreductase